MPNIQDVVHESETQRQFVRLHIPAQVMIDGEKYEVHDLSSGGLSAEGVTNKIEVNSITSLILTLPFAAFSLDITIEAEILYYNKNDKIMGCQFVNISPDQVSLLNHVIKSYTAGEIVKSGALLNVAARENFVNPRKKAATDKVPVIDVKKQIPRLLLVGLLGLVALAFIAGNVYDGLFIIKSNNAIVQGSEIQVRTADQGIFISKLSADVKTVDKREELGSIDGNDIKSPCDCLVTQIHRQDGEFVIPGDPIVSLVPKDSSPWLTTTLKPAEASRISLNSSAKIIIAGTKVEMPGKVVSIKAETANSNYYGPRMVQIRVMPDQKLPIDLIGRPAKIIFEIN